VNSQTSKNTESSISGNVPFEAEVFTDMYPQVSPHDGVRRMQIINIPIAPTAFVATSTILNSKSIGSVTIVSPDPLVEAKLDLNMYSDPADPLSDINLAVNAVSLSSAVYYKFIQFFF